MFKGLEPVYTLEPADEFLILIAYVQGPLNVHAGVSIPYACSLRTSVVRRLQVNFANILDPDQKIIGPELDLNCLTL